MRVSTELETSADRAWETVQEVDTLRYVTRGLLGFRSLGPVPDRIREGDSYRLRLLFFGVLPAWPHELEIIRVDQARRELYTNERGGPVRTWNHLISILPVAAARCRYTDTIEIGAGALTPIVWCYTQLFYRYRQRRWRRLALSLVEARS